MEDDDPEDDLDELLDEVEHKFCRSDATPTRPTRADWSGAPTQPGGSRATHSGDAEEDLAALLEELLDEEDDASARAQIEQTPKESKAVGNSLTQSEEKKSCDQLRCTSCDFRVLTFDDHEWDGSCDYLFLRNNMPDGERLRARLRRSRGRRAYACQCSWFSTGDLADLSQQHQLRWVCGKHPA